jgi:hypothetical protein
MDKTLYLKVVKGGTDLETAMRDLRGGGFESTKKQDDELREQMGCKHIRYVYDVEFMIQKYTDRRLPGIIGTEYFCKVLCRRYSRWPNFLPVAVSNGCVRVRFKDLKRAVWFSKDLLSTRHSYQIGNVWIGTLVRPNGKGKAESAAAGE